MRITALGLALLAGCAAGPAWVRTRPPVFQPDASAPAIEGRGQAASVRNPVLAWDIAEERARAEIYAAVDQYLARLAHDYLAGRPDQEPAETKTLVTALQKISWRMVVDGSRRVDRWVDERRHTSYALWRLELRVVDERLAQSDALDPAFKEFAAKDGPRAFAALAKR